MAFGNSSYQIETAEYGYPITPSDTVVSGVPFKYLYVGGAGNITLVDVGGNVVTFTAVPVGTQLYMAGKRVNATGTTATFLVGMV